MSETIIINGITYGKQEIDGNTVIHRYNQNHKMRVELKFSEKSSPNSMIEVLSKQYLNRLLGTAKSGDNPWKI